MARIERRILIVGLLLTFAFFVLAGWGFITGTIPASKWLTTAGLALTASGLFQLEVSGLFTRVLEFFSDPEEYPYGPPSAVTRELMYDPDSKVRNWFRERLLFEPRTGFWMIVAGTLVQTIAVWL